jgi:hypothetical protein
VASGLPPDGAEEESIISVSAFERLSDAAKAKYISSLPCSADLLQSMSPPRHGEISASPRSRAPASESPPFELRKNWLSQQVQGYGTTLQDNGVTTTVAYDTDEHLRREEPRVLSAASRTKSPTVHPACVSHTVPLVSNDAPASLEAVRSTLEQALALELETCKPVSNELFAGLRVQNVKNGAAARVPAAHQLKVGDVILSVQDNRVDGISPKLLADAISSFATPSVLTVNSSHSALRLVLQRPSGVNQHGGRNWEHREVTILPAADTREFAPQANSPYISPSLPKHDPVPFRTCAARAHCLLILLLICERVNHGHTFTHACMNARNHASAHAAILGPGVADAQNIPVYGLERCVGLRQQSTGLRQQSAGRVRTLNPKSYPLCIESSAT